MPPSVLLGLIAAAALFGDLPCAMLAILGLLLVVLTEGEWCLDSCLQPHYDGAAACAVCLETLNDCVKTGCGHAFHAECLRGWKHKATCPLCRAPFRRLRHDWVWFNPRKNAELRGTRL